MPSTSKKQHNFMAAVAHNPSFAKKAGVPQSVGKEFTTADKGKSFKKGGDMATKMNPQMMAALMQKKKAPAKPTTAPSPDMGSMGAMAGPGGMSGMPGMKRGGKTKKYAAGGMTESEGPRNMGSDVEKGSNTKRAHGEHGIQKRGLTKAKQISMPGNKGMKRGGKV